MDDPLFHTDESVVPVHFGNDWVPDWLDEHLPSPAAVKAEERFVESLFSSNVPDSSSLDAAPGVTDASAGGRSSRKRRRRHDALEGDARFTAPAAAAPSTEEPLPVTVFVNLHPHGFSINDQPILHPYSHKTRSLLEAVDAGRLPPDLLDMLRDIPCHFRDGCVLVELRDFRLGAREPQCRQVLLRPDLESLVDDVNRLWAAEAAPRQWGADEYLELERRIVHAQAPPICLDPSPAVCAVAHALHYNQQKMSYRARSTVAPAAHADVHARSLVHFLLQRGYVPKPAELVSPPVARYRAPPIRALDALPRPEVAAAARRAQHLRLSASGAADPRPSTAVDVEVRDRVMRLQGQRTFVLMSIEQKAVGGYDGLLRLGRLPESTDGERVLRFSLGSAQSAKMFIEQIRTLCKKKDIYNVVYDSYFVMLQQKALLQQQSLQRQQLAVAQQQQQHQQQQLPPPPHIK